MPTSLYHYCTNDTFLKIVSGCSVQLSDLRLSNDTMEGTWVREVIEKMCNDDPQLSLWASRIASEIDDILWISTSSGFCMSEEADSLSQWRGYADDGAGINIGFSYDALKDHANFTNDSNRTSSLLRVEYDVDLQKHNLLPVLSGIKSCIAQGAFGFVGSLGLLGSQEEILTRQAEIDNANHRLRQELIGILKHIYEYKNPAFK